MARAMRLTWMGGWLLSVAVAGAGGYSLARSDVPGPAPEDARVLARLDAQQALLQSLRAQVGAMDLRLAEMRHASGVTPGRMEAPTAAAVMARTVGTLEPEVSATETERRARVVEEEEALVARGTSLVEAGLAARRWRADDVQSLRSVLPQMPREQRDALLSQLITAFNEGRIKADGPGPLF